MALTDKLHALDHNFFPGTRDAEEDAETFLRRVAASRVISPAQAGDVMAALREYFGVEPQQHAGDEGDEAKDEADEPSEAEGSASDDERDGASDGESDGEKDDDKDA